MEIAHRIARLRADPAAFSDLSLREFKEVVAELLASKGWQVSFTAPARDSGVHILAITSDIDEIELTWLVECKHRRDRPVGVAALDQLVEVRKRLRVSHALLVTTSPVTASAAYVADLAGIGIADSAVVASWVEQYAPAETAPHAVSRRFRSCFVSHSTADQAFVVQLVDRLKAAGVRVWCAPEDLVPGRKIHEEVAGAIASFDRLVVVLSDASMASRWVQTEVRWARRRELEEGTRVLFPVSLVQFGTLKGWQLFDADSGQDLAAEIREYFVADFSAWRNRRAFAESVTTLLRGLEAGM